MDIHSIIQNDISRYLENVEYQKWLEQECPPGLRLATTFALYFSAFLDLQKGLHFAIIDSGHALGCAELMPVPIWGTIVCPTEASGQVCRLIFSNEKTKNACNTKPPQIAEIPAQAAELTDAAILSYPDAIEAQLPPEALVERIWVKVCEVKIGIKKSYLSKLTAEAEPPARARATWNAAQDRPIDGLVRVASIRGERYLNGGLTFNQVSESDGRLTAKRKIYNQRPGGHKTHSNREIYVGQQLFHEPTAGLLLDKNGAIVQDIDCQYDLVRIAANGQTKQFKRIERLQGAWLSVGTTNNVLSHFLFESLKRIYLASSLLSFSVILPSVTGEMIQEVMTSLRRRRVVKDFIIAEPNVLYQPGQTVYVRDDVRDMNLTEMLAFDRVHNCDPPLFEGKNIYLSRTDATSSRRLLNELDVEAAARASGCEVLKFSDFGFDEKIRIMKGARHLVGPAGAAFSLRAMRGPKPLRVSPFLSDRFVWQDGYIPQLVFPSDEFEILELPGLPSFGADLHYFCRNHASYIFGNKMFEYLEKTLIK